MCREVVRERHAVVVLGVVRADLTLCWTGIGMTACVAPLTTVDLDAAPRDLGGSGSGVTNAAARLGALVAVAALGFAFGGTSTSDVAPRQIEIPPVSIFLASFR